jgi:hypothetical protein
VAVTWPYGRAYGSGEGHFVGVVERLDPDESGWGDYFTLRDDKGVIFDYYTPLCSKIEIL